MNAKHDTITHVRWGSLPYTAGSGLHIGVGADALFPNAIGLDVAGAPAAHQIVPRMDRLTIVPDDAYDWVFIGEAMRRVREPRSLLAEAWRVLAVGGNLILFQPTDVQLGWLIEGAPDHARLASLKIGKRRVDVIAKAPPGTGRVDARLEVAPDQKTCSVVRLGAFGDALWASSILPHLKDEGYHVTVYVEAAGEQVLRHDPHVDRIIVVDEKRLSLEVAPEFFTHESKRYDRHINLVESVEKNLLAVPGDFRFYWPDYERRRIFGANYLEAVHHLAGVPQIYHQRFYATDEERDHARARREGAAQVAAIAVSGSTLPKAWPHVDVLADALVERGYQVFLLGDLRQPYAQRPGVHVIGASWPVREALAFVQQADVVIGQETGLLNAVAFEPMRKVVLLSHSTPHNLTRDWVNTVALSGDVPCYPCHRIHYIQNGWQHCNQDKATGMAACQAAISAESVLEAALREFARAPLALMLGVSDTIEEASPEFRRVAEANGRALEAAA